MKFDLLQLMMYMYVIPFVTFSIRINADLVSIMPGKFSKTDIIQLLRLENKKNNKTEYEVEEEEILKHNLTKADIIEFEKYLEAYLAMVQERNRSKEQNGQKINGNVTFSNDSSSSDKRKNIIKPSQMQNETVYDDKDIQKEDIKIPKKIDRLGEDGKMEDLDVKKNKTKITDANDEGVTVRKNIDSENKLQRINVNSTSYEEDFLGESIKTSDIAPVLIDAMNKKRVLIQKKVLHIPLNRPVLKTEENIPTNDKNNSTDATEYSANTNNTVANANRHKPSANISFTPIEINKISDASSKILTQSILKQENLQVDQPLSKTQPIPIFQPERTLNTTEKQLPKLTNTTTVKSLTSNLQTDKPTLLKQNKTQQTKSHLQLQQSHSTGLPPEYTNDILKPEIGERNVIKRLINLIVSLVVIGLIMGVLLGLIIVMFLNSKK